MKSEGFLARAGVVFLLAVVCYAVSYRAIEHRRTRKGPWEVTFKTLLGGIPALIVNQRTLGISNVQIRFSQEASASTNADKTIAFKEPRPVPYELPLGQCIFMDTTFLPGTLVMKLFGHEIELLPRVLVIDREEHKWTSDSTLDLPGRGASTNRTEP
jgi:hypothetical protein